MEPHPLTEPWYQISVRRAKNLIHASFSHTLTSATLRFSSDWSMCTLAVDFHHLASRLAWRTYQKSCSNEHLLLFIKNQRNNYL